MIRIAAATRYGRLLERATQDLVTLARLRRDELFVDIGHGVGSVALQLAWTVGCNARGVEKYNVHTCIPKLFELILE